MLFYHHLSNLVHCNLVFQTNCLCRTVPRCTKYHNTQGICGLPNCCLLLLAFLGSGVCVRNPASFAVFWSEVCQTNDSSKTSCHTSSIWAYFHLFASFQSWWFRLFIQKSSFLLRIRLDSRSVHASTDSGSKCVSVSAWAPANNKTAGGPILRCWRFQWPPLSWPFPVLARGVMRKKKFCPQGIW